MLNIFYSCKNSTNIHLSFPTCIWKLSLAYVFTFISISCPAVHVGLPVNSTVVVCHDVPTSSVVAPESVTGDPLVSKTEISILLFAASAEVDLYVSCNDPSAHRTKSSGKVNGTIMSKSCNESRVLVHW